jgi:hypothetical protein
MYHAHPLNDSTLVALAEIWGLRGVFCTSVCLRFHGSRWLDSEIFPIPYVFFSLSCSSVLLYKWSIRNDYTASYKTGGVVERSDEND